MALFKFFAFENNTNKISHKCRTRIEVKLFYTVKRIKEMQYSEEAFFSF